MCRQKEKTVFFGQQQRLVEQQQRERRRERQEGKERRGRRRGKGQAEGGGEGADRDRRGRQTRKAEIVAQDDFHFPAQLGPYHNQARSGSGVRQIRGISARGAGGPPA